MARLHRVVVLVISVAALVIVGCKRSSPAGAHLPTRVEHPNGLTLDVPSKLRVIRLPKGFRLQPHDTSRRTPTVLEIVVREGPIKVPAGARERRHHEQTLLYRVHRSEGGSGGAEYLLEAWKALPRGHVALDLHAQAEHGTADLDLAWQVLGSASREKQR